MIIEKFKLLSERGMFGVFTPLGQIMGVSSRRIRMFFIYITFLSFGSPIFIYLALAFIMNINTFIVQKRRNPIWDF
ncbi:MAG: PspC family transcriptional regulator [Bacteroidota bacterium]|nr:PspC family transcriptional regulator [Bacteroidota bacterium]